MIFDTFPQLLGETPPNPEYLMRGSSLTLVHKITHLALTNLVRDPRLVPLIDCDTAEFKNVPL